MPEESLAKIQSAREYIRSNEVTLEDTDGGVGERLLVPVDKDAAISQDHITVAMAQKAWDTVAMKMVTRRDATPKELKDMVDAAKTIVEMRGFAYAKDRPATLPLQQANAVGQGIGQALGNMIANGAKPDVVVDRLAQLRKAGETKVVDIDAK